MRLQGKVAIVTGSGAGIGEAIVTRMSQDGASIVVNDIDVERMNAVVEKLTSAGCKAIACKADVTRRSEVRDLVAATLAKFGKVDVLVNNAGVSRHRPFMEMGDEDWDFVLAIDLKGVFNCIQAVARPMMDRRYGKIVNISSVSGMGGSADPPGANANYAAAKAGVIQLTKTCAAQLGPYGINVNCIAPGTMQTRFLYTTRSPEEVEKHLELRKGNCALRRVGKPEDIANAALFLASDEASFISAHVLCVNGGRNDLM
jgi:NAD(P)-dependent dehydrogenase (short-subunit alcohol dehydrogenase family)